MCTIVIKLSRKKCIIHVDISHLAACMILLKKVIIYQKILHVFSKFEVAAVGLVQGRVTGTRKKMP